MTDNEIAKQITDIFKTMRFVEVRVTPGFPNTFWLIFESETEAVGRLGFCPTLTVEVKEGVHVLPRMNIYVEPFTK